MRRAVFITAVVLGAGGAACASILGIEDGVLDSNAANDGGIDLCTADGGVPVDSTQLFVSAEVGEDTASCGNKDAPCKTIKAALDALSPNVKRIYLATPRHPGVKYVETVTLPPNIELQGGWSVRGSAQSGLEWQPICESSLIDPQQIPNIVGSESATIRLVDTPGVTLKNVVIGTRTPGPGESLYGIVATGASTVVTLDHVIVSVGKAGDGVDGDAGEDGVVGPDGPCPIGVGASPEAGTDGLPGGAFTFDVDGIHGTEPGPGGPGGLGRNGTVPEDGGCHAYATCALGSLGCKSNAGTSCGSPGAVGCGGAPGTGGAGGQNGGSAVGIYASGATVIVNVGSINVGGGGNGGNGGKGGNGGEGTLGEGGGGSGGDAFLYVNLDASISSDAATPNPTPPAGSKGEPGGQAGKSGTYGP